MKFHEQIELMKECVVPVMLMSNKSDKEIKRVVSPKEEFILAKKLKCKFLEASVKNYLTVKKIFHDVGQMLHQQHKQEQHMHDQNTRPIHVKACFRCVIL